MQVSGMRFHTKKELRSNLPLRPPVFKTTGVMRPPFQIPKSTFFTVIHLCLETTFLQFLEQPLKTGSTVSEKIIIIHFIEVFKWFMESRKWNSAQSDVYVHYTIPKLIILYLFTKLQIIHH